MMREDLSGPENSDEEEEEEEEPPVSKWQGIESIFEAYQEYIEGKQLPCFSLYKSQLLLGFFFCIN